MVVAAPNTYYNSVNFAASYQWDDEGRMTSLQYPTVSAKGSFGNMPVNMPIAAMQYDVNGRLAGMTMDDRNGQGPQPFASASYYAAGQLNTLSWGGYTETRTYNSLMQLTNQSVPYALNMTYNYSATQNNGRITSSVDGITGENTTYSYDALNRLTNASNSLWSEAYTYDGFGNLTSKTGSGGSPNPAPTVSLTYNSKNQPTNIYYDANGNQNGCNNSPQCGNSYTGENRMTLEVLGSYPYPANIYAYDPWGKRVMSGYNPNYSSPQPSYTYTFYGVTGQKLAMVTCNGSNYPAYPTCAIVGQNVYFGKKLITAGGVNVVTDRLGSVRANGQGESSAYYPYGEERTSTVDGREKFGTYFRDTIGQDYADQRYYGSGTGSFFTPDPGGIKTADPTDPGSWNRYAYVGGDPLNYRDPAGTSREDPNFCDIYPDDPSCDPWYEPFWSPPQNPKKTPQPCSFSAQTLQNYMLNTPAWDAQGNPIPTGSDSRPLANYAATIMADAVADNVDPRLLVAIAFDEGKWGGDSDAASTENSFGLHNSSGHLANLTNAGGWAAAIGAAAGTVETMISNGLTSVAQLYTGKPGAYCQGRSCASMQASVVAGQLRAMGGSRVALTSPCHTDKNGNYYANQ